MPLMKGIIRHQQQQRIAAAAYQSALLDAVCHERLTRTKLESSSASQEGMLFLPLPGRQA